MKAELPEQGDRPSAPPDMAALLSSHPILVTGADGFVGSHLTEMILDFGARVHVFVRGTSSGSLNNISHLRDRLVVHRGDLTDQATVLRALKALRSDGGRPVVFHLAAQAHVGESWARPYETIATNLLGTLNLLRSIVDLDLDIHKFDTAGSSEEYGNISEEMRAHYRLDSQGLILDERSPVNPQSIYATSKLAADFLSRSFFQAYGVPVVVTRMFNNYGPRQSPRFVTAAIITQALSSDVIRLGYVLAKRDFCFVRDGALGHMHAALLGKPGDVYVYGYGQNLSILEWLNMIIDIGRQDGYWGAKTFETETPELARLGNSEVLELRVDYGKLHTLTGWKPQHTWEQGLRETVRWYAENRERWLGRLQR
jgi:dTDP-glucose 4,6-dehydratase